MSISIVFNQRQPWVPALSEFVHFPQKMIFQDGHFQKQVYKALQSALNQSLFIQRKDNFQNTSWGQPAYFFSSLVEEKGRGLHKKFPS